MVCCPKIFCFKEAYTVRGDVFWPSKHPPTFYQSSNTEHSEAKSTLAISAEQEEGLYRTCPKSLPQGLFYSMDWMLFLAGISSNWCSLRRRLSTGIGRVTSLLTCTKMLMKCKCMDMKLTHSKKSHLLTSLAVERHYMLRYHWLMK